MNPGATRRAALVLFASLLVPAAALGVVLWPSPAREPPAATSPSAREEAPAKEPPVDGIRGRILDADGQGVPGAAVHVVLAGAPQRLLAETKADPGGAFTLAPQGDERVRIVAEHEPEGAVTSAAMRLEEGKTGPITLVLSATSGVRGTIVDEQDHPIAAATVEVDALAWKVPGATSDASGAFRLSAVPEQATSIVASARGFEPAHVALPARDPDADRVVRVRLVAAAAFGGMVYGVDGEAVVADVVACAGQPEEARVTSGEDGAFELPPTAVGCRVEADRPGFAPSDAVVAAEGRRLELRLRPGGAIEGHVVDARGEGVPAFRLGIESFVAPRGAVLDRGPRAFEDVRGAFRWDLLTPGTYVLTVAAPGLAPTRSDPIDVERGTATRVRVVIAPGGAVVGRVTDDHGAPLGGVSVAFDSVSSVLAGADATRTDDDGRYRLAGAPSGAFTLRAQKAGYRTKMVSGLRVASGGTLAADVTLTGADGGFELGGVGINLSAAGGRLVVAAVGATDPAARAGIAAGDRVVAIDGESTAGMSLADAVQRLRGEAGTSVGLSVERTGDGRRVDAIVVRGTIVR